MINTIANRKTIYDVADESGVSITTVSRFLNNPENVKKTTGIKIAEAMDKLDYIPQGNTGSRSRRCVGRIGVLTPFFPAPSFVQRLRGMINPLKEANYEVVIYTIETAEQLDEYLKSVPFTKRLDGLIIISVKLSKEQHKILTSSKLNVVLIESDNNDFTRILADDYQGGRLAAELFIKKNYLPCAFIGDSLKDLPYSCLPSETRFKGFSETLKVNGEMILKKNILESKTIVEDAERVFTDYLKKGNKPRAVFAMSDIQAIGAYRAIKKSGYKVPGDIAILGFDNIDAAMWMEISTISQHLADSGAIAARHLLDKIYGDSKTVMKMNLQVSLIERGTT